jgi:hypothetical protein
MTEGPVRLPSKPARPPPKNKYKQIVITLVCSAALAAGSCWGFEKAPMSSWGTLASCLLHRLWRLSWL